METQVRTPQMVFMQPQRLVVPLFQRPYVWNEENQWEPLWNDVVRVTERLLKKPHDKHHPHFLGAVVLQQLHRKTGQMQERMIIDGQQRLTTLQILLDALHGEFRAVGASAPAARLEPLVANAEPFRANPEDQFKVWPTNRDRPAFNAVMSAPPPIDYDQIGFRGERMVEAHRYFATQSRTWLISGSSADTQERAAAIESVVRDLLQIVVIDLAVDENAQEIFETLNARGAQLTAADLIKNFIFQRLIENKVDVEKAYEQYWREFETGFWETEISVGRHLYSRSAIFLNHWLVARTGEEVVAREVFDRFKRFADHECNVPMLSLLAHVRRAADVYRQFITDAENRTGPLSRLGLFGYRTSALESEVVKPLVLCLLDPEETPIPDHDISRALDVVESWMVRRMLLRATTKSYSQVISELVALVRKCGRKDVGAEFEKLLAAHSSGSQYWPDDQELRTELETLLAYRRIGRGRLRMVLEAIEDFKRGWRDGKSGLGGERVPRGKFAIEHVMPRKWHAQWPLDGDSQTEVEREAAIHTIGNLTLLTGSLNSKVSNGPWRGANSKRQGLEGHDVLILNRDLLRQAGDSWSESTIRLRTKELVGILLEVWKVPEGHRSGYSPDRQPSLRKHLHLSDLIAGGALTGGISLYPRRKKHQGAVATLLPDGRIELNGEIFTSPSEAAKKVTGNPTNGWWFFLVDQATKRSLKTVRREYLEAMAVDTEDDESDDDDDDDS